MHLGQVKGSTWECFGKSPRPKGVFGLMDLNQVRGSTQQCLREQSGKSPRPKGVLGLMHISQVRGSTQEGLRDCSGKSPQSKGDNPSKGQNSKKIKKNEKVREKDKERERERVLFSKWYLPILQRTMWLQMLKEMCRLNVQNMCHNAWLFGITCTYF